MVDQLNKADLQEAIELFYFAYRAFTSSSDKILSDKGLGRAHHRILYFVGRYAGININELLGVLEVSKQALNAPLRKLIEMDLIVSETAEHDRRVKQLTLSKKGQNLEAALTQVQMKQLESVFADVEGRAVKGWREIMQKIPLV
ncbi:MarR family transcriptional regulator [Gammaproteobacteria bacterium]|nr:MarR family transcriptional regulator [Gammaproteobacteria bacterium]